MSGTTLQLSSACHRGKRHDWCLSHTCQCECHGQRQRQLTEQRRQSVDCRGLSSDEVCKQAGITYRQLDYWCRVGIVSPSTPASGSGSQRRFTDDDVRRVVALAALVIAFDVRAEKGVPMQALVRVMGDRAYRRRLIEALEAIDAESVPA